MYVKTRWFQICLWCSPLLFVKDVRFDSYCFKWVVQPARKINKTTLWFFQDYIRVLSHAAARGAMANYALHERLRQLQGFLARNNRLVLDQETHAALAKLGLCCWWDARSMKLVKSCLCFRMGFGPEAKKNNRRSSLKQNALLGEKADRSLHIIAFYYIGDIDDETIYLDIIWYQLYELLQDVFCWCVLTSKIILADFPEKNPPWPPFT